MTTTYKVRLIKRKQKKAAEIDITIDVAEDDDQIAKGYVPMTKNKKIWKQVVYKIGVWITAEIWLNLIGLDNIADYSEFTFGNIQKPMPTAYTTLSQNFDFGQKTKY